MYFQVREDDYSGPRTASQLPLNKNKSTLLALSSIIFVRSPVLLASKKHRQFKDIKLYVLSFIGNKNPRFAFCIK